MEMPVFHTYFCPRFGWEDETAQFLFPSHSYSFQCILFTTQTGEPIPNLWCGCCKTEINGSGGMTWVYRTLWWLRSSPSLLCTFGCCTGELHKMALITSVPTAICAPTIAYRDWQLNGFSLRPLIPPWSTKHCPPQRLWWEHCSSRSPIKLTPTMFNISASVFIYCSISQAVAVLYLPIAEERVPSMIFIPERCLSHCHCHWC